MARARIEFKKGDGVTHYFRMPADAWTAGGKLFFAAKTTPDDDSSDSLAVINKSFDDTTVADITVNGVAYKEYELAFVAADTDDVTFDDGSKKKTYLGEFQFVPLSGAPVTCPGNDQFIETIVYADIKRAIA